MLRFLTRLFGRARARPHLTDDLSWFFPPATVVDPVPWDTYWQNQLSHGLAGFVHLFCDDGMLVDVMRANGLSTVLCVGNGISQEPRALAWAGFDVTALDLSPFATQVARDATPPDDLLGQLIGGRPRGTPGELHFAAGDLMDAGCCTGPYDVVIDRRTLQLYPEADRATAVQAVVSRLGPRGVFVSHAHNGRWKPPQPRVHPLESWVRAAGLPVSWGDQPLNGRVAWLQLTTG